ncbi:MAG: SDR family oxidoreductase [Pseudomonadota bacterium]
MNFGLQNKRVLVCGGSGGIGFAVAKVFREEGAHVTIFSRNEGKIKEALSALGQDPLKTDYLVADFSNPSEVEKTLSQYLSNHPGFDILVNNTGGPPPGPAAMADVEEFQAAFSQHLICNHIITKKLIPHMSQQKFGRVINIISTSVKQPLENLGVSNTVRGAVANWAKTLANELGPVGITVNNVLPGATETGRLSQILERKAKAKAMSVEEWAHFEKSHIPLRRFGRPEDIANAVVFLASEAASYITGTNLTVDGGRTSSL